MTTTDPIRASGNDGLREAAQALSDLLETTLRGNGRGYEVWVQELDALARSDAATDDQKRAVAVVRHLMRASHAPQAVQASTEPGK